MTNRTLRLTQWSPTLIFIIASLGIATAGTLYYLKQKELYQREVFAQLNAIADMKTSEIVEWRRERLNDANYLSHDQLIASEILRAATKKSSESSLQPPMAWMTAMYGSMQYESIRVFNSNGRLLTAIPNEEGHYDSGLSSLMRETMKSHEVVLSDIFPDELNSKPKLSLLIPIVSSTNPKGDAMALAALTIDPYTRLYPMIRSWPIPSQSSEFVLVRHDGDDILYLNELRHRTNTALPLRLPASDMSLPAAHAVRGEQGLFEGKDYRGVNVISVTRVIPDSAWFLVAKVDRDEKFADFYYRADLIGLAVGLLILCAGTTIGFVARRLQIESFRKESEAAARHSALLRHLDYLTKYANDIIILSDREGRIVQANERATEVYGYSLDELLGMREELLEAPEARNRVKAPISELIEHGHLYETVHVRKDGSRFNIEVSVRAISLKGEIFYQSIGRDITERRRAENALSESEHRYRSLFENMLEGFAHCKMLFDDHDHPVDFVYLDVNDAFEGLTGLADVVGKRVTEVIPGIRESNHELFEIYGRVASTGIPERFEIDFKPLGRWLSIAVYSPQKGHFVAVFDDITERKSAETRMRLQSLALESAANGIVITDREGMILWVNAAFSKMTGYESCESIGKNPRELVKSGVEPDSLYVDLWKTILDGRVWSGQVVNRRKDGSLYNEEQTITPLLDDQGNVTHFVAIKQDITERKRTSAMLGQAEERYREMFENAVFGIFEANTVGRFTDVNPALVRMLGYDSVEEVLELEIAMDVYRSRTQRDQLVAQCRRDGRLENCEAEWKKKDGSPINVRLNARCLLDDDGNHTGFEVISEDITERRLLEEEYLQAQKMEAVGRLAGGIAHDFNNLLTVISGYSELALRKLDENDPVWKNIKEVKIAANRASRLTRQLLVFSRKHPSQTRLVDLDSIVKDTEKMLKRLIGEDVELVTALGDGLRSIKADPSHLELALVNLVVNARDAMPSGGRLRIETSNVVLTDDDLRLMPSAKIGPHVLLQIGDSGCGMDEETLRRVFEPFFTTKDPEKGTGLGLSTVYGIVNQCGGHIHVKSEVGHGTIFKLYLPAAEGNAETVSQESAGTDLIKGTGSVLVVEDDSGLRKLAVEVLSRCGYEVFEAANAGEAWLICEQSSIHIDMMITDVIMPHMNGPELAARLKKIIPDLRVLFMSGYTDNLLDQQGMLESGDLFLQKPFEPNELAKMVREALVVQRTSHVM